MFDFISYVRDSGLQVRILPPLPGILINLEVRDADTGYVEKCAITDYEASKCTNIDKYTGEMLDSMAARIGAKKAQLYANRHKSNQRQELETFWKNSNPSKLTEG